MSLTYSSQWFFPSCPPITKPCQLTSFSCSWSLKETHNLFMAFGQDCYWVPPVRLMGPRSSEIKARHDLGIWVYWLSVGKLGWVTGQKCPCTHSMRGQNDHVRQTYKYVCAGHSLGGTDRRWVQLSYSTLPLLYLLSVPSFPLNSELQYEHQGFLPPPPLLCPEHCSGTVFILPWTWNDDNPPSFLYWLQADVSLSTFKMDWTDLTLFRDNALIRTRTAKYDEWATKWHTWHTIHVTDILRNSGPSLSAQSCVQQTIGEYIMVLWHCKGRNVQ